MLMTACPTKSELVGHRATTLLVVHTPYTKCIYIALTYTSTTCAASREGRVFFYLYLRKKSGRKFWSYIESIGREEQKRRRRTGESFLFSLPELPRSDLHIFKSGRALLGRTSPSCKLREPSENERKSVLNCTTVDPAADRSGSTLATLCPCVRKKQTKQTKLLIVNEGTTIPCFSLGNDRSGLFDH